jgi:protein-tyrosine phosphatase
VIDIHCHILPNMDDGPSDSTKFTEMAKKAVNSGITHLFATPHHLNGIYENPKALIIERVKEFNRNLERENVPLIIHTGQELRIHREIFVSLEMDEILTLDNRGKFLLIELPSFEIPLYTHQVVYELLLKGVTPIIVHPERNKGFIQNQNLLFELIEEGALTQVTAGSIIGYFGKKIKSFSENMIKNNLVHFIATDAHNIRNRGFYLQEAYETITKLYGIQYTYYFKENCELLLNGQNLQIEPPTSIKKIFWGIF